MNEGQRLNGKTTSPGLLLGGYAPALVVVITLALLVWLVPSTAPEESKVRKTAGRTVMV